jgi:hypothetical protein
MISINMNKKFILANLAMLAIGASAEEALVAPLGCGATAGKHVRLADYSHTLFPASADANNFPAGEDIFAGYNSANPGSKDDWALMETAAPGAEAFCDDAAKALNDFGDLVFSWTPDAPADSAEAFVGEPDQWQQTIVDAMNGAQCSISPEDPAVLDYMETMSYWFAQKQRMLKAYELLNSRFVGNQLVPSLEEYNGAIAELKKNIEKRKNAVSALLEASRNLRPGPELAAGSGKATTMAAVDYDEATELLLEDGTSDPTEGVRGHMHALREEIAAAGTKIATAAQKVKRDTIRYSKLNQIANEQERLKSFENRVKESSYGMLRNCLVNYQISNEIA